MSEAPRTVPNDPPRGSAKADAAAAEYPNDQAIESAALAGAVAIQRMVAERNGLRSRIGLQERELSALRATNEELRRRLVLIHQHYVELAKQIVGRLEQFDGSVREIVQEAHVAPSAHEDAQTAALVQRLAEQQGAASPSKPNGADKPNA
jgi:predicted ribosome quality control (RQC) complex YloA/Tae2 family protein